MLSVLASPRGTSRRRGFGRRVRFATADVRLTGHAGLVTVTELDRVLGIRQAMDESVGPIKERARGVSAGGLLLSMACAQLAGEDFLVGMDRRRADAAGQSLEPVPAPASTTTGQLAKRFTPTHLAGIESGLGLINNRMLGLVPRRRRARLLSSVTIDGDTTDVEVYGSKKQDAVYFAADLAKHCLARGVEFAIGVKRNSAVVRANRTGPTAGWHPAKHMEHAEVAIIDYLPGSWPQDAGITCIARRTRIPVQLIPTDPRARKLRTIDKDQLALGLTGQIDHVYGYSFILTNLDVSTPTKLVQVEHWYRHRTDIEALNKDAKLGAALRHLPSGSRTVNNVWMWAALLGCAIS